MGDPAAENHLSPEAFCALAHRVAELIADYWRTIESRPVTPRVKPGEILGQLPLSPPREGAARDVDAAWDAILDDVQRLILPGLTHWQHPSFFAFFPANTSPAAVLGELLSAGLGVQGMLWATSPACTELEMRVMDWLAQALGLPTRFTFSDPASTGGGVIQGTASEAVLAALVAARTRARRGLADPRHAPLVAYASTQAHSSMVKAAMVAGLILGPEDREGLRLVETDSAGAMRVDRLEAMLREDHAAGKVPFFIAASVGTTGTTAVDDLQAIAHAADTVLPPSARARVWLHADAAHAGAALVAEEFRWMIRGLEAFDSFCTNPHKWLLTTFDCDAFYVADRSALVDAMSVTPEYLRNAASDSGQVVDYRDWHVPLGRRFRALKLWFVLRHYGVDGLAAYIREHVRLAQLLEALVRGDDRFELTAPRTMNLVCFRPRPRPGESQAEIDRRTRALMDQANATGRVYLTHAMLPHGGVTLRLAVGGTFTQERHVRDAWTLLASLARS